MRLLQVNIDGFGQLHNRQFTFHAPIVVVYGVNEAGKSTLFQFIYTMFYGFARKNQPVQLQKPLKGGLHGGSLIFMDGQQKVYQITRYHQQNQGKVTISEANWDETSHNWLPIEQFTVMEQANFERIYLSSMNPRLFKELCAITLDELQATSLMTEEELSQYLYHASWESGKYITALEKHLQQEMDTLFRPRGQNQQLNRHYKQLEALHKQRKQSDNDIVRYNELTAFIQEAQQTADQLQGRYHLLEEEVQLVKKAIQQREWWLEEQQAKRYMEKLSDAVKLPPEIGQLWQGESERRRGLLEQFDQYQLELASVEQQFSQNAYSMEIEAIVSEVEKLIQLWPKIEQLQQETKDRQEELHRLERRMTDELQRLPILLTMTELQHINISVDEYREYEQLKESYIDCEKQCHSVKDMLDQLRYSKELIDQQQQHVNKSIVENHQALRQFMIEERFIPGDNTAFLDAVAVTESAFRQYEYNLVKLGVQQEKVVQQRKLATAQASARPFPQLKYMLAAIILFSLVAIVGIVLLIGGIELLPRGAMISVASTTAITALLLGVTYRSLLSQLGAVSLQALSPDDEVMLDIKLALANLVEAPLQLSAVHYYEFKRTLLEKIAHIKQLYHELERNKLKQDELIIKRDQLSAELQIKEQEQTRYMQELAYLDKNWLKLLQFKNLPDQLSIYDFELLAKQLPSIQADQEQMTYIQQLLGRYEEQITQYRDAIASAQEKNWPRRIHETDLELIIASMQVQLKHHHDNKQLTLLQQKEQQQLIQKLDYTSQQLDKCNAALQSILERAEAIDEERFMSLLQSREQYEQWEQRFHMNYVQRTAGQSSEQTAAIETLYQQFDQGGLVDRKDQLMNEINEIHDQQQRKVEERGRFLQEQDSMVQSSSKQQLELDITQLEATIAEELQQYTRLAIGRALVGQTKELFEQERQPAVLESASKYFHILTSGKYNKVIANLEKRSLQLRTEEGILVASELLSRGTAEQLYLSIRLAIHDGAAEHMQLPLLLDDPFVNFDAQRLKQAMHTLESFGQSRQLIYFTCHLHTRQQFTEHFPQLNVIEMEQAILV